MWSRKQVAVINGVACGIGWLHMLAQRLSQI